MISYTRALPVSIGDKITSKQLGNLASAFNDRLAGGVGDCTQRVHYATAGFFRQIRNPDAQGQFPPQMEFFDVFQNLEPGSAQWPVAPAGDYEGANIVSPLPRFVFGSQHDNAYGEADRLSLIPNIDSGSSASANWESAKAQRGAYDPSTGAFDSPAFYVARSFAQFTYDSNSPYGNTAGGYLPGPIFQGACSAPDTEFPSFDVFVTELATGTETHFGTCPSIPTDAAGVQETPWAILIYLNDGSIQTFPTNRYIQGPYSSNPTLRKTASGFDRRVTGNVFSEYRGTAAQRAAASNANAFDFQAFFTSQYSLAPAYGTESGDTISGDYPTYLKTFTGTLPSGLLQSINGGNGWTIRDGFVVASMLIVGSGIADPVTVEVLSGDTVIDTFTAMPTSGVIDAYHVIPNAQQCLPLQCRIKNPVRAIGTTSLRIEFTHVYAYKPQFPDAYLVLRIAGGISGPVDTDGVGLTQERSKELWQEYYASGKISGVQIDQSLDAINQNGYFDTARRMSKWIRNITRRNFVGYELSGGNSILYFSRYAYGLDGGARVDLFDGIGPAIDPVPSGSLKNGRKYVARDGKIAYNGAIIAQDGTFTATTVIEYSGQGTAYEADGIIHVAEPADFTNEWLMDFNFSIYRPHDEASLFKPSVFADYFAYSDRCVAGSFAASADSAFRSFVRMGGLGFPFPSENVTGNRYAHTANGNQINAALGCSGDPVCETYMRNFYKSCRIYEPPVEIDKAEILIESGQQLLKLTMKGRVHHCPTAPSTIARDPATWVEADIIAEPFRSHENALREYLLQSYGGDFRCTMGDNASGQPGNQSINGYIVSYFSPDKPSGACYPSFQLTKKIGRPYEDSNDTTEPTDSPFQYDQFLQMEWYLRCMAEGFVDGPTSEAAICDGSSQISVYDYTYENLCLQATGHPWMRSLASTVRPDGPQGFGSIPNTVAYAEVYNQFANAVNLLDKARVMLPYRVEGRTTVGVGLKSKPVDWPSGSVCFETYDSSVRGMTSIPDMPITYDAPGAWSTLTYNPTTPIYALASAGFQVGVGGCAGSDWNLYTQCEKLELRLVFDGSWGEDAALPETISDWADTAGAGFLALVTVETNKAKRRQTTTSGDSFQCNAAALFDPVNSIGYNYDVVSESHTSCVISQTGVYDSCELKPAGDALLQGENSIPSACRISWDGDYKIYLLGDANGNFLKVPLI